MMKKLFKWKEENNGSINCPECGGKMPVKDRGEDSSNGYYEIKRTYECKKCGKEYGSVELIAPGKEIDSFLAAMNTLNGSMDDLYAALKKLLDASKKLDGCKNPVGHDAYSMN